MAGRTIAVGDLHGDLETLLVLVSRLPPLDAHDTIVFLGDYVDRGPQSAQLIHFIRHELPQKTAAKIVCLRGNHEDAWLRVIDEGWPEFVFPPANGTRECMASFIGRPVPQGSLPDADSLMLFSGTFYPPDVVQWMRDLPFYYEDDNAIYVHAGLPWRDGEWIHPENVDDPNLLLWVRDPRFFLEYVGKTVLCGHTLTNTLPDLSLYTPDDPDDLYWGGGSAYCLDTGCGKGGFLTAFELPAHQVYESR